jgi:hypothetical protein
VEILTEALVSVADELSVDEVTVEIELEEFPPASPLKAVPPK